MHSTLLLHSTAQSSSQGLNLKQPNYSNKLSIYLTSHLKVKIGARMLDRLGEIPSTQVTNLLTIIQKTPPWHNCLNIEMKNYLLEPYLDSIEDLLSFWRMTIKRINKSMCQTEFCLEYLRADEISAVYSDLEIIVNFLR